MKKFILSSIVAMSLSASANAEILNASDYFKGLIDAGITVQKADNLWQLGYLNSGDFTLFNYSTSVPTTEDALNNFSSFDFYKNSTYYGFGINRTDADLRVFDGVVAENAIYAHPGDFTGGDIVLRFNAQTAANYTFATEFNIVHHGEAGLDVSLNNDSGTSSLFSDSYSFSSSTSFQDTLYLSASDSVDFTIERFNGTWNGDSTSIVANVTMEESTVPVPASGVLLLLALCGFSTKRKKKL